MNKSIHIIILLLVMVSHCAYGQDTYQTEHEADEYLLSDFENSNYISYSKEENIWDLNHAIHGDVLPSKWNSSSINLPYFGKVRLSSKIEIEALIIEELLGSYQNYTAELYNPLPLTYPEEKTSNTGYVVFIEIKDLPESTLSQLPIIPDSIRVRLNATYRDSQLRPTQVKLEGRVITANYFERSIEINRYIEVKIGPFEWESVEVIAPMINWDQHYTLSQIFILDDEHELPFVMVEDHNSSYSLAYLSSQIKAKETSRVGNPTIRAVPNPAINDITFVVENMRPGKYKIRIKNILGSLLKEGQIDISKGQSLQLDISMLNKGSYFYSLEDEEGNIISTKRLIILRP